MGYLRKKKILFTNLLVGNVIMKFYGYGMMLKKSVDELIPLFEEEAKQIKSKNFKAMKMKVGLGPKKI